MSPVRGHLPRVILSASVDTEEDNWDPARGGVTVANIAQLPRMHERVSALGLRVTYFSAHSVVTDRSAAAVLRDLSAAGAEIGGHLHPWNTPPRLEPALPRNSMLKNLPAELQHRKISELTTRFTDALGWAPTSFRAGRFALGTATVAALAANGYRVDSSVMPWVDWTSTDDGPNFFGAPQRVYRLGADAPVTQPASRGPMIEVPMSTGFNRWPFDRWAMVHRRLTSGAVRQLRLAGIAARTGVLRRILLSPEGADAADMLRLARVLVRHGVEHLQIMWHSPTIVPGLTPFGRTPADVELLYRNVAEFVEGLQRFATVGFATVGETAQRLAAIADDSAGRRAPSSA